MLLGVLLGVAAGALWGLIYIAPLAVPEYNPVLVALSRFIAFGVISLPFLWVFRRELKAFTRADIWESFKLPLLGNVLFYCLLTICIRLAGAPAGRHVYGGHSRAGGHRLQHPLCGFQVSRLPGAKFFRRSL